MVTVVRFISIFSKWFICHAESYQNAFGSEVNGFETRQEAVVFAESQGCVVEVHLFDRLQCF